MALLPYVDPETVTPPVAEALHALPDLRVFAMLAHAQSAFRPWLELGGALLGALELDPVLRELAVLQVAHLTGCDYERVQHAAIAVGVGASPAQVGAIAAGRPGDQGFTRLQKEVLSFATAAVRAGRAPARTVTDLAEELGPRQVVELLLVIGYYTGVAVLAGSLDLDPDQPAQMAVGDLAARGSV